MKLSYRLGALAASIVGILILAGVLFGNGAKLPGNINPNQDIRTICLALWAALVPLWWTIEEKVWLPPNASAKARATFRDNQGKARILWLAAGIAICFVVGVTPGRG